MLLGFLECGTNQVDPRMTQALFGFSRRNQFEVQRPPEASRHQYFQRVADYLGTSPSDFPEPMNRKKRRLEELPPAPHVPETVTVPTREELKEQKKRDRYLLNMLKLRIHPIMEQIRKQKKFRTGVIDENQIRYLYEEEDPTMVSTDLPQNERSRDQYRPYEKGVDSHGEPGLKETATGKFFYNMEIVTIEKRLSNGYYKRPKDFLSDIKKLAKDAKAIGDADRLLKANELLANVEVDVGLIEADTTFVAELENVYAREMKREKDLMEKQKRLMGAEEERRLQLMPPGDTQNNLGITSEQSTGPVVLGEPTTNGILKHPVTPLDPSQPTQSSSLSHGSLPIYDLNDLGPRDRHSNGTSVPSHDNEMQMSNSRDGSSTSPDQGTLDSSFGQSAQTRPLSSYIGAANSLAQRKALNQLSQASVSTPMAEGSNPQDYINYASTTTSSDKKNTGSSGDKIYSQSDKPTQSDKASTQNEKTSSQIEKTSSQIDKTSSQIDKPSSHNGKTSTQSTQDSNGRMDDPDLSMLPNFPLPASQLPDTQPQNCMYYYSGGSSLAVY